MSEATPQHYKLCSECKKPIAFSADYYRCSVSTCNRKRTGLTFCSLACFEAHLPTARHRDAWAERQRSPSVAAARAEREAEERDGAADDEADDTVERPAAPAQRRLVSPARPAASTSEEQDDRGEPEADVLIVVSKLKKYVRDRSGMNTSDGVVPILSDHVRELCREAIRQAGQDGRRTVLDRDFTKVLEQLAGASPEGNFRSRR